MNTHSDESYIDIITRLSADCITLAYRCLEPGVGYIIADKAIELASQHAEIS